ncbi:hypothetical protein [Gryllotalpicola ginsengisoli]|uniref:hypothetical protein n=1 Tax=Gryllotalpicola ginsengisoli TaxID=444608 RepID=UPI0012DF3017|nr:hypothetical protein [Gryllotalpicola ginsengisoli]
MAKYTTDNGSMQVEKHSDVLYRVVTDAGVQGYIERVGPVWVTLHGARLDRCVEVGQSKTLESAVALLARRR